MTVLGIEEGKSEVALATQRKGRRGAAAAWVASLSFFMVSSVNLRAPKALNVALQKESVIFMVSWLFLR